MRANKHMEGFYATPEEHAAIEKFAKSHRMNKSVALRMILFGLLPAIELKEGES